MKAFLAFFLEKRLKSRGLQSVSTSVVWQPLLFRREHFWPTS